MIGNPESKSFWDHISKRVGRRFIVEKVLTSLWVGE